MVGDCVHLVAVVIILLHIMERILMDNKLIILSRVAWVTRQITSGSWFDTSFNWTLDFTHL
jgi:hypothetical protein